MFELAECLFVRGCLDPSEGRASPFNRASYSMPLQQGTYEKFSVKARSLETTVQVYHLLLSKSSTQK